MTKYTVRVYYASSGAGPYVDYEVISDLIAALGSKVLLNFTSADPNRPEMIKVFGVMNLVNGGFELGDKTGWSWTGNEPAVVGTEGGWAPYAGVYQCRPKYTAPNYLPFTLYQGPLGIPINGIAECSLWYRAGSNYDFFEVECSDTTKLTIGLTNVTTTWTKKDLTKIAGWASLAGKTLSYYRVYRTLAYINTLYIDECLVRTI